MYFIDGAPGSQVLATQVTEENIGPLVKVVNGEIFDNPRDGKLLYFNDLLARNMYDTAAAVGDYVIADMGGLYVPCEKEIFELQYIRQ